MTRRVAAFVVAAGALAAAAAEEGIGPGRYEAHQVPTLLMAIGDASSIVRVEVTAVPAEGAVPVEVLEVYFGDFENYGWVDPTYLVPDESEMGAHDVRFEFQPGRQYVLFATRGVGGVYKPYLFWNTRWGVADVVNGKVDLSRLAEGPKQIPIAEFREIVRQGKYGF